jgi:N-acetylglucosaminyldiphosphoundecaprenol N-acetyl-beta-D-mannosaminyltransferase
MISETCSSARSVIGFPVTALPFNMQIQLMLDWAKSHLSKVVCVANVHMLVEARQDPAFAAVLDSADMLTPDGMPLVWMIRLMGVPEQERVAGLDIFQALCERASAENVSIFFLGSQEEILQKIHDRLNKEFPNLQIAGMEPLPFRPLTSVEDEAVIQKINQSGAGLVFVSLGCPKQERWMAAHRGKIQSVMIGLGGAFPVYAGLHKRAPQAIREAGLEWLYRLLQEPRRLWKRYGSTIPPFIFLALKQLACSQTDSQFTSQKKA